MAAAERTSAGELEQQVTPLELFFDLVFVFAFTQVTGLLSAQPTGRGLLQGTLILAALWWAWTAYAWLTNTVDADEGSVRLAMFAAMAAMLIVALATPKAFGDDALAFGCAYLVVRLLHLLLYGWASHDAGVRGAVMRLAPTATLGPLLIIAASAFDGFAQGALWALALALDYAGPALGGMEGWTLSPGHFAERHGLIVIIALGESIVAIGVGASGVGLDAQELTAAALAIVVVACLWWTYFDVVAIAAERRLRRADRLERLALARDSYSYLHLPMIAGIVLVALGVKKALPHPGEPLADVPAIALYGGVALYLCAHIGFRLRNMGTVNVPRIVCIALTLALIPLAMNVDAVIALAALAAICAGLVCFEVVRFREARARLRAAAREA